MRRRLAALAAGLAAVVITAAVVVGVPAALVHFVGWPLPTQLPTLQQLTTILTHRTITDTMAATFVVKSLAVVMWVAWAQLGIGLTLETAAVMRGRTAPRPLVLKPFQPAAAQLVASMTLLVSTLPVSRVHPVGVWAAAAAPHTAAVATLAPQPTGPHSPPPQPKPATQLTSDHHSGVYTVRTPRDSLWQIAEATLGDGTRWREIRDLNLGRTMPDGSTITAATEAVQPGWQLLLPPDATLPAGLPSTASPNGEPTTASPATAPPEASPTPQENTVTVERGDHFWGLAKQALTQAWGRPPTDDELTPYWRTVVNSNRHLLLPPHDPDLIYPDQRFLLPPPPPSPAANNKGQEGATQQTPPPPPDPAGRDRPQEQRSQAEQDIQTSDRTSAPGQTSPPVAQPPTAVHPTASANGQAAPRPAESTTSATPHAQQPAQPPPPVRAPLPQPGAPPVGAARPTAPPPPAPPPEVDEGSADDDEVSTARAIKGGALAVAAAGVVVALERLRRARLRRRLPGERLILPPEPQLRTERQLRDLADHDAAEFIDLALRALAGWRRQAGQPIPAVELVSVTDHELALHLHQADHDAPPEWQVSDEGRTWMLPADLDRDELAEQAYGVPAPTPALVTIGSTAGGRRRVLANLSRAQVLGIIGEPDQVRFTMLTQALELATSRFADYVRVVLTGPRLELPELERIEVTSPYVLLDQLEALAKWVEQLPAEEDLDEDCTPTVVFCAGVDQRISYGLQQLARRTQGRAVVVVEGPTDAGWSLTVEDDRCHLHPPGLTLDRCSFDDREMADINLLVEGAKAPPTAPTEDPEAIPADTVVNLPPAEETETVEVRILGPVEIVDATRPCPTQKAEELIVYLALHPSGADPDSLMEALWPKEPPSPGRLRNEVSRARQTLGHDPDREPYLPHASHGRYQLSERVRLDLDRFRAHVAVAREEVQAPVHLRAALELVRGRPLETASRGYGWASPFIYPLEAEIVDAAHRLAQTCLDAGQPQQAMWAVERGLRAGPFSEILHRDWMRAADAAGDTAQVHAIMDRLRQQLAEDAQGHNGDDRLHPDTVATYRELTTHRPTLNARPPVRPAEPDRHAL